MNPLTIVLILAGALGLAAMAVIIVIGFAGDKAPARIRRALAAYWTIFTLTVGAWTAAGLTL